jgi:hypothetical protein
MSNFLIDETGYFWPSQIRVPAKQIAPNKSLVGRLTIDTEGRSRLELDGVFPNSLGPFAAFANRGALPEDQSIHGILKTSNKSVRLYQLNRDGGRFRSNGISFERYVARRCLIGEGPFHDRRVPLKFKRLTIELKGFEQWLWLNGINVVREESGVEAHYQTPDKLSYALDDSELQVVFGIMGPYRGKSTHASLNLTEYAELIQITHRSMYLEELEARYTLISDLFMLLTGSDYNLDWPVGTYGPEGKEESFRLYFHRFASSDTDPPEPHDYWITFPQLCNQLGERFGQWRRRCEEWGPGVYLYLATKRSVSMYEEHRFVMLVWGLESLHRRRAERARGSEKLARKIDRILSQVEKVKDKKWLDRQLQHAGEPPLEQRLFETLEKLPLDIDLKGLQKFCTDCANKRNDISHFGGRRHDDGYKNEVEELHKRSEALSNLYHILLLREIGFDDERLRFIATRSLRSFRIRSSLVAVGLLPASVLKNSAVDAAVDEAMRKNAQNTASTSASSKSADTNLATTLVTIETKERPA